MSANFYKELKSFREFNGAFAVENYTEVPTDWSVIITDIVGSTVAVENGKYKDVNLIGAACIAVLRKQGEYPFVFGGDGASFIVPPSILDDVIEDLVKIKNSALNRFDLGLRIGVVPVKEIVKTKKLKFAKLRISKGAYISKFTGGGLEFADDLIKKDPKYLIGISNDSEASFDGLSCRWDPIQNTRGMILTLMVKSNDFSVYSKVQDSIDSIVGVDINKLNPVKVDEMKYMTLSEIFSNEKSYEQSTYSFSSFKRKFEIIMAYLIFKTFRKYQPEFFKNYSKSMANHSDFRKFDDCLRMVIDCSRSECEQIINKLELMKEVTFGHHISDTALMTCLVDGLGEGEHIHFIDGGSGGYTLAAKELKHKLKSLQEAI